MTVFHRFLVPALLAGCIVTSSAAAQAPTTAVTVRPEDVIRPDELAKMIAGPAANRPVLLQVGFQALYKGKHIPGSVYAGPASEPEGLAALKKTLAPLPRSGAVVLYCGCCPWKDCPNVRPAYQTARALGFKKVRVLLIAQNLQQDWVAKGLPVEPHP
jgi:3-mercaptopyruvate sulfurtransferase SseA